MIDRLTDQPTDSYRAIYRFYVSIDRKTDIIDRKNNIVINRTIDYKQLPIDVYHNYFYEPKIYSSKQKLNM